MDLSNEHMGVFRIHSGDDLRNYCVQRTTRASLAAWKTIRRIHLRNNFPQHSDSTLLAPHWSVDEWARGGQI